MKKTAAVLVAVLLAACRDMSGMETPAEIPYQSSEVPLLTAPGDNYVAVDGGECFGRCAAFEIYVFDTGKVIFRGGRFTSRPGIAESRIAPEGFLELKRLLEESRAMSHRRHFNCKTDHSTFNVIVTEDERIRIARLDYGCDPDAQILDRVVDAFIRVSNSSDLIGKSE